jgi:putative ATPase
VSDLFGTAEGGRDAPLADRMRPRTLDDVVGQDHIVGPGRLLRRAIQADRLSSILLYGPPGTGKTSLARVVANTTKSAFESLNAVLTGVKDVREAIDRADERRRLYGKRTILFVDEVHRWNKAQQDALLPWVENGTVVLIGATTENPFFEVNRALVSRSRIFQLVALGKDELMETARRAIADAERGYGAWRVEFEEGALEHLVDTANGDARSLLNALELAVETSDGEGGQRAGPAGTGSVKWPPAPGATIRVSFAAAEESIQKKAVLYDRDGDYHFDTISAFIKSVRGSDPDAALYWLAKMVRAGEDPGFIFRRMIISAGEDVGLADPNAVVVVQACAAAFERVGLPEGHFQLAEAALYLATAPKSNTTLAFFDALAAVEKEDAEVPNHLRDDHRDKEGFGHGDGYIYPHAYREHWAAQRYLPKALAGRVFYVPSECGYEKGIREEVLRKRELQAAVVLAEIDGADAEEALTYSAASKGRDAWIKRLEAGRAGLLQRDREAVFAEAAPLRHHRVLAVPADDGLLLWEALRRTPEGLAAGVVRSAEAREAILRLAAGMDETEMPRIALGTPGTCAPPAPDEAEREFGCAVFDRIVSREPWRRGVGAAGPAEAFAEWARAAAALLAPGGVVALLQSIPGRGERLSRILAEGGAAEAGLAEELAFAEDRFFAAETASSWAWSAADIEQAFAAAGFRTGVSELEDREERRIAEREIEKWFDPGQSPWGKAVVGAMGADRAARAKEALAEIAGRGPVRWRRGALLLRAELVG